MEKREIDLSKPLRLVSFEEDGSLKLQSNATRFMKHHLKSPCAFISIIGPIRQGKSLLMNYILGNLSKNTASDTRFSMSNGLESHTRGLYIYPIPILHQSIFYYFLDCQGKENKKEEDIKIYTLICLITSLCVFQTMKTITYDHDFLLPYLKSRRYIDEVLANDPQYQEQLLIINKGMQLLFLVRDCPEKKNKEITEVFRKVFLEPEPEIEGEDVDTNDLKKTEVHKRNTVRQMLKEDFQLSEADLFTLPYYLTQIEDEYEWTNYSKDINIDHLSPQFKDKAHAFIRTKIFNNTMTKPLGYQRNRDGFTPIKGPEVANLVRLYIKMINQNKVHNIFSDIESMMLKIKDDLFKSYLPSLITLFDSCVESDYSLECREQFCQHYKDIFEKILESFTEEAQKQGQIYQVKVPSMKLLSWVEELQKVFDRKLEQLVETFEKDLEIRRLKREAEEKERARLEELKRLEWEKEQELQRHKEEEERQRQREEQLACQLQSISEVPKKNVASGQGDILGNGIGGQTDFLFNPPLTTNFQSTGSRVSSNNSSRLHSTSRSRLDDFDTSQLVFRKDGNLDMRYNVNLEYLGTKRKSPSYLPRKKDGTLDMRFSVCKKYRKKR